MNREELEALLRDVESDHVERTRSLDKADKFGEAICAFANDMPGNRRPGYLFVGANDDGSAAGITVEDRLLQALAGFRSDGNILPPPALNVQKHALAGGEMVVVEVMPSDLPPVRYKGRVWIRVGPRRAIATESEERILAERRTALAKTWDARPCPESSLTDLALELFALSYRPFAVSSDVIRENHRSLESQLAALRFYDTRLSCPTNAGVLLFAKDPVYFYAGAYVQYVRYAGATLADEVSKERRYAGDLLSVLRGLDELAAEIADTRPEALPSGGDRAVFAYPLRAIHELVMNAVIHRNYDGSTTPVMINHFEDRLEIRSPGGLYGDLTEEMFPDATSYRNPIIAEAAKTLGFVNRYGRGIATAQDALARNGSPPAEFGIKPNQLVVTVRRRP
jgi:ATP-dependent DNA helicase RecG